jgi:predicted DNA-binding transcriptional regulator AlpA
MQNDDLITVQQFATLCGVSRSKLYNAMRSSQFNLPKAVHRRGHQSLYSRKACEEYARTNKLSDTKIDIFFCSPDARPVIDKTLTLQFLTGNSYNKAMGIILNRVPDRLGW